MTHRTLRLLVTGKTVLAGLLASSVVFAATTIGTNIATDGTLSVVGNAGFGDATPDAVVTVRGAVAPTGTLLEVTNANNSSRYFTVASTSTRVISGRLETPAHANGNGLLLPTNSGAPAGVTGTAEGDIVWDSTGDALYVYDGSAFTEVGGGSVTTLEQAYNAATGTAEIGLNSTNGALTISNAIGGLGINGNLFEIQNRTTAGGAYDTRYFTVSATGASILTSAPTATLHVRHATDNAGTALRITSFGGTDLITIDHQGNIVGSRSLTLERSASIATGADEFWPSAAVSVAPTSSFAQNLLELKTGSTFRFAVKASGSTGILTNNPQAELDVRDALSSPSTNIFQVANLNDSTRYFTVASTSTRVISGRLETPAHANGQGLLLPTNAGAPSGVTGTAEGDIVWDSTGNALYVYDGSAFATVGGGSVTTLEQAYNAATGTTEIGLNSTKGAFTISNAIGGLGINGNLFEVQNRTTSGGGYNQRYFTVSTTSTGILTNSPTAALTVQNPSDTGGTVLDLRLSSGSVFSVDYQGNVVASRTLTLERSAPHATRADEFWPYPALEIIPGTSFAQDLISAKTGVTTRFAVQADGDVQLTAGIDTQNGTGSVSTNAVTVSTTSGVITDATDVNTDTTRAAITWTNTRIAATSVVLASICSTPDAGARLGVAVTPGSGSATITVYNSGTANQTSDYKICFQVTN